MTDLVVGDNQAPLTGIYSQNGQTASDLIKTFLTEYTADIYLQQFPGVIDGLKKVQLRFFWGLYLANRLTSPMKSSRAIAELSDLHPFGDASMYNAVVRLAQIWHTNPTLVNFHGNVGTYSGKSQAAMRYTDLSLSSFANALLFRGVDMTVLPMMRGTAADREPKYFIPSLPAALIYDNLTIGIGNQSKTASLYLDNICDLVSLYAKHTKSHGMAQFPFAAHADKFLPEFPDKGILVNADELTQAYKSRAYNATIRIDGIVEIDRDRIVIKTVPHGANYAGLLERLQDACLVRNSIHDRMIRDVKALSSRPDVGGITIFPRQGVHTLHLWSLIHTFVRITGAFHPNPNYSLPDGTIIKVDYINLLAEWFTARRAAVMSSKRRQLHNLTRRKWIIEAQLVVVDHTDRVLEITRNNDEADAIVLLGKEFNLTQFQAESLVDQKIRVLAKSSGAALLKQLENVNNQINELHASFSRVPDEISDIAQKMKKEYSYTRRTEIPHYLGYVELTPDNSIKPHGIVLYESVEEVEAIANSFPKDQVKVVPFVGKHKLLANYDGKVVKDYLHKYMFVQIMSFSSDPGKGYYTLSIVDGSACFVNGVVMPKLGEQHFYVKKNVVGLTRRGEIRTFPISEVRQRKTIGSRGASTDLIYAFSPKNHETPFFIAHFNTKEKNTLYLQKVMPAEKKFITSPVGDVEVFVSEAGSGWFISPPGAALARCNVRVMQINNADALLGGKKHVKIDIGSPKIKRNPHINLIS